jgi:hypothetical protein
LIQVRVVGAVVQIIRYAIAITVSFGATVSFFITYQRQTGITAMGRAASTAASICAVAVSGIVAGGAVGIIGGAAVSGFIAGLATVAIPIGTGAGRNAMDGAGAARTGVGAVAELAIIAGSVVVDIQATRSRVAGIVGAVIAIIADER